MDHLNDNVNCDFEFGPLQKLAKTNQLMAFKHEGFWQLVWIMLNLYILY